MQAAGWDQLSVEWLALPMAVSMDGQKAAVTAANSAVETVEYWVVLAVAYSAALKVLKMAGLKADKKAYKNWIRQNFKIQEIKNI